MSAALHTVHRATALAPCLARRGDSAALLLLEDGVYAALAGHHPPLPKGAFVLAEDLARRGLAEAALADGVARLDLVGMVRLCTQHHPIVAWF
jgi:tRNA 2-thiouridine synthesizing protein B